MRAPVLRGALAVLACSAGFALSCWVLDRFVDPISAGGGRIEWVRDHGADYDTLFVGSSRTARQVVPSVFDRAMAEAGRPTRSFNLGMPGMRAPEDGYVAERALSGRTTPLRYLVVECTPVRLGIPPGDRETARAVYWHDAPRVRVLWNRIWAPQQVSHGGHLDQRIVRRNLLEMLDHLRHWGWNASRLGRGADLLRTALSPPDERAPALWLGPAGDGYNPGIVRPPLLGRELERYQRELEAARQDAHRIYHGDVESQNELRRKRDLAERYGARLVLVAPPITGRTFAPVPEKGVLFLDFSDPGRYPELFAPLHRNDSGHLNRAGAEIYSRLLAREISAADAARS